MGEKKEGFHWLILGGTGFIGRNLVEYLVENKLASQITVADKSMPVTSYLNKTHKAIFKDHVKFVQSDLAKDDHVKRVFKDRKFDYVINLCGETRFGLTEHDYQIRCQEPATKCSKAALENGSKRYVEISTAQVYQGTKNASDEDAKVEPWTLQAKEAVKTVDGLPWVILRPVVVYGVGGLTGFSPRLTCAATYVKSGKTMKFPWDKKLSVNMVHVSDLCGAILAACTELKPGTTYNVADPNGQTNQGDLAKVLSDLFGIKTGFLGNYVTKGSTTISLNMVADYANDMHVPDWTRMCQEAGIYNTPLTPYIDKELLSNNHLRINGEKIMKDSNFTYKRKFSKDSVKEQLVSFIDQKIFPPLELK